MNPYVCHRPHVTRLVGRSVLVRLIHGEVRIAGILAQVIGIAMIHAVTTIDHIIDATRRLLPMRYRVLRAV